MEMMRALGAGKINLLQKGGNYGFSANHHHLHSSHSKPIQTYNSSEVKPARNYYKIITPTQAIFYDGTKYPLLKGKFLIASLGEGSIYALSFNNTGSITEEIAIRLPELRGHLISVAKAPSGEIYFGGENIYKLVSLDNTESILTYFIRVASQNVTINGLSFDQGNKVLSINFTNSNKTDNAGFTVVYQLHCLHPYKFQFQELSLVKFMM